MKKNKQLFIGVSIAVILIAAIIFGVVRKFSSETIIKGKDVNELYSGISVNQKTPVKGTVSLKDNSLYDELPEIDKYPLSVAGNGDVDIEIFSSGEKAGSDYESWLIDVANTFNSENHRTSGGQTVSISVRSVSSGLAADYIISGKYLPDLYTPSNVLFGEYCKSQGGDIETLNESIAGNVAGILITKGKGYSSFRDVSEAVIDGKINLGYTNPTTSATGMNFLITFLKEYGGEDLFSSQVSSKFSTFQSNIPFVAYTTMQMRDSASNGTLDGMVMEYQTYINENNLNSLYDFIPFGIRHDNPLYIVNTSGKNKSQMEAVNLINDYLMSPQSQTIATNKGFNNNSSYNSSYSISGSEISKSLQLYKENKDSGQDIVAVFVADCSGSMSGAPIKQLKEGLANGMTYINSNNSIGLVSYSSSVNIEVPIAKLDLNQKSYFQGALNGLTASGQTASYDALIVALKMVKDSLEANSNAKGMVFLLSDGWANKGHSLDDITYAVQESEIPIYTIGYTKEADTKSLKSISSINEAVCINADSDDIVYQIKQLFNSQM